MQGKIMTPSTIYCDNCGYANRAQARFCVSCGQVMPTTLPQAGQSNASLPSFNQNTVFPASTGLLATHTLLNQRYRILKPLGKGGMGAVYKAQDSQLGDRAVAIKEMSQRGLDPQELQEAADAFKNDAHMLAGLFHRHLPRIYDHFSDAGRWYLVMDFIDGDTLEDYLTKAGGKLPMKEVLDIGIQLATVLSYLHQHQPPIIFRDLKPANVMRTPDGDLFLIDFGIARHFKQGQARDTIAYGSAGYSAPEQYGKAQTTPQSDIYSLGATLHQSLSGNEPYLTPFKFAPLTDPAIPNELKSLITRMVDMDANKRPRSANEVRQELRRIVNLPAASQLPPTQYIQPSYVVPTQHVVQTIEAKQKVQQGSTFIDNGLYQEALFVCEQAISLDPNYAAAYRNKGIALKNLKRYSEALAAYDQAIRLDPTYAPIYYNKGNVLQLLGRSREAQQMFDKARQLGYTG